MFPVRDDPGSSPRAHTIPTYFRCFSLVHLYKHSPVHASFLLRCLWIMENKMETTRVIRVI